MIAAGPGWIAFDAATESVLVRHDGDWVAIGSFLGAVDRFGVNATADATNRLAVCSNALLFTGVEAAEGGTGDVRFVVNKEADGDTASLLFQSGFSGRAEVGLAGDTDFVFKVSADGSAWTESIRIDKDTGLAAILYDNVVSGLAATTVQDAIDEVAATGGGGAVGSVFGRTGTVVAATGDYDAVEVDFTPAGAIASTNVQAAIEELDTEKLGKAGGTMTGFITLHADPDTAMKAATKQYVDQIIAAQDAMVFKGVIDCSANPNYPAADRGNTYRVSVAGKIGGGSGVNVEAGDLLLCLTDGTSAGNQATVGSSWSIAQVNLDGAVIGPASVTDSHFAQFDGTSGKLLKGGDAAAALALRVSGSEADFVALMNATAQRLGLDDTAYADPIGLDSGNVSSARDLVALAIRLRREALFRRIVDTPRITVGSADTPHPLENRNTLVLEEPFVDGIKTGTTLDAGYVLVGSGERRGVELVSALLGAPSEAARNDATLELLEFGTSLYRRRALVERDERIASIPLDDGRGRLRLVAAGTVTAVARADQPVEVEFDLPEAPEGAVARGESFGSAAVLLDGEPAGDVEVVAAHAVEAPPDDDSGLPGWAVVVLAGAGVIAAGLATAAIVVARRPPR